MDTGSINFINSIIFTISILAAIIGTIFYNEERVIAKRVITVLYIAFIIPFSLSDILSFSQSNSIVVGLIISLYIITALIITVLYKHKSCFFLILASACLLVPYISNMQYTNMGYFMFGSWVE